MSGVVEYKKNGVKENLNSVLFYLLKSYFNVPASAC